jgi:hypothetical protein
VLVGKDGQGSSPRVELRLAGTFGVLRDGTELADGELGSRKSRTLLKLLAVGALFLGPDRMPSEAFTDQLHQSLLA